MTSIMTRKWSITSSLRKKTDVPNGQDLDDLADRARAAGQAGGRRRRSSARPRVEKEFEILKLTTIHDQLEA